MFQQGKQAKISLFVYQAPVGRHANATKDKLHQTSIGGDCLNSTVMGWGCAGFLYHGLWATVGGGNLSHAHTIIPTRVGFGCEPFGRIFRSWNRQLGWEGTRVRDHRTARIRDLQS